MYYYFFTIFNHLTQINVLSGLKTIEGSSFLYNVSLYMSFLGQVVQNWEKVLHQSLQYSIYYIKLWMALEGPFFVWMT